jgi:MFS family permease
LANRLPRQVRLFGGVSLLNDFASEMVYPLLPAFVTSVLGAGAAALGALDGAADFSSAALKYGTGRLADRPARRKPLVILGYALAVAVRPLIALTGAAWQVIGLRVVDRLGKGIRTPARDAIIADATVPELRGRAFGLQRGLDHTGAVLGPLVAWLLLSTGTVGVRGVIAASLIPGALVLALAVWATAGGAIGSADVAAQHAAPLDATTDFPRPSPSSTILPIAAFHLLRVPEALIILRAQQLGVPVAAVTVLWAGLHVVKAGSSFVGGRLSDRMGARRTMWLGWLSYSALAVGFALARGAGEAWVLFLALGLVSGLTESPERALVAEGAGARQGSGFGSYHALMGVAALAGGLALGLLYQRAGGVVAFWGSAGAGAVLCLVSAVLTPRRRPGVDE